MDQVIDLRSDTVTRPTPDMRAAMAEAEVGDDVFGEDPTIAALEERIAHILGKEAAIYVPSGTLSNLLGVRVHCDPGDALICEANAHLYVYEQGGYAQFCGVTAHTIQGEYGILQPSDFTGTVHGYDDHSTRTRLVCLENTHNRGSGRIQPYEYVEEICGWAHDQGLATHLDGARLMNAVVASGISAADWAQHFDTVNVCFSKGLGAPVGSALIGPTDLIRKARRHRKALGGGMRQAGVIAAAALYALDHHIERLAEDHSNAQIFSNAVHQCDGLTLSPPDVHTNIVFFDVDPALGSAKELQARLKEHGVLVLALGASRIRAVTHLDVTQEEVTRAGQILQEVTAGVGVKS